MIKKIENIVEQACARDANIFGYGIWTHQITQVAKNGKRLAKLFNPNPEIVEIAARLHDYASVKDEALPVPLYFCHCTRNELFRN